VEVSILIHKHFDGEQHNWEILNVYSDPSMATHARNGLAKKHKKTNNAWIRKGGIGSNDTFKIQKYEIIEANRQT